MLAAAVVAPLALAAPKAHADSADALVNLQAAFNGATSEWVDRLPGDIDLARLTSVAGDPRSENSLVFFAEFGDLHFNNGSGWTRVGDAFRETAEFPFHQYHYEADDVTSMRTSDGVTQIQYTDVIVGAFAILNINEPDVSASTLGRTGLTDGLGAQDPTTGEATGPIEINSDLSYGGSLDSQEVMFDGINSTLYFHLETGTDLGKVAFVTEDSTGRINVVFNLGEADQVVHSTGFYGVVTNPRLDVSEDGSVRLNFTHLDYDRGAPYEAVWTLVEGNEQEPTQLELIGLLFSEENPGGESSVQLETNPAAADYQGPVVSTGEMVTLRPEVNEPELLETVSWGIIHPDGTQEDIQADILSFAPTAPGQYQITVQLNGGEIYETSFDTVNTSDSYEDGDIVITGETVNDVNNGEESEGAMTPTEGALTVIESEGVKLYGLDTMGDGETARVDLSGIHEQIVVQLNGEQVTIQTNGDTGYILGTVEPGTGAGAKAVSLDGYGLANFKTLEILSNDGSMVLGDEPVKVGLTTITEEAKTVTDPEDEGHGCSTAPGKGGFGASALAFLTVLAGAARRRTS